MVLFVCKWAHIMIVCVKFAGFFLENKQSKTCVVGTQKNRLIEVVLLDTHHPCLSQEMGNTMVSYYHIHPYLVA